MPSGVASYGASTWLGTVFGIGDVPSGYYVALLTDEPGPDMDGDVLADLEPSAGAYARQHYSAGETFWGLNGGFITNLQDIDYGLPTEDWGDLSHFALVTAASSGDLYAWGALLNPQYVSSNIQVVLPAGGLVVALAGVDNSITP